MHPTFGKARLLALSLISITTLAYAQPGDSPFGDNQGGPPGKRKPEAQQCPPTTADTQMVSPQPKPAFWYYCVSSRQFYPYVHDCDNGWKIIPAQPPAGEQAEPPLVH